MAMQTQLLFFDPDAVRDHPLNYLASFWDTQNADNYRGVIAVCKEEIFITYLFILLTVWGMAVLLTAFAYLLLRYTRSEVEDDVEIGGEYVIEDGAKDEKGRSMEYGGVGSRNLEIGSEDLWKFETQPDFNYCQEKDYLDIDDKEGFRVL